LRALNEAPVTDPEYPPELGAAVVLVAVGVGVAAAADFVGVGAGVLDALCVAAALGFEVTCALLVAAAFDGEAVGVVAAGSGATDVAAATGFASVAGVPPPSDPANPLMS